MEYTIEGKLKKVMDEQTFSSGFSKREFVITTNSDYPQEVKLEFTKDKCSILDNYKLEQDVKVSFNIRGSYYEPKDSYFVNLQAWRIEAGEQVEQATYTPDISGTAQPEPEPILDPNDGNQLPF